MSNFESEIVKLWSHIQDLEKKSGERLSKLEEMAESADFNIRTLESKVHKLQKEEQTVIEELAYIQSQSMRSNLIFSNMPESKDQHEDAEATI